MAARVTVGAASKTLRAALLAAFSLRGLCPQNLTKRSRAIGTRRVSEGKSRNFAHPSLTPRVSNFWAQRGCQPPRKHRRWQRRPRGASTGAGSNCHGDEAERTARTASARALRRSQPASIVSLVQLSKNEIGDRPQASGLRLPVKISLATQTASLTRPLASLPLDPSVPPFQHRPRSHEAKELFAFGGAPGKGARREFPEYVQVSTSAQHFCSIWIERRPRALTAR